MKNEGKKRRPWLWLLPVLGLAALALGLWILPKGSTQPAAARGSRTGKAASAPYLVEEASFFADFVIRDDQVYFLCLLTVHNPSKEAIPVQIKGDFTEDWEGGLLLQRKLFAYQLDYTASSDFLSLDADTQKQMTADDRRRFFLLWPGNNDFLVVFPGTHGKADVKQNRLLPEISFLPLTDVTPEEISTTMDCRIYKDPESCRTFLSDGKETEVLCYPGDYGFTSAAAWDYDDNGVPDLLFTGSGGSGIHSSYLTLFDRTSREAQDLYVYTPRDHTPREAYGSDLVVERETDERGAPVFTVYTADVQVQNDDLTDLRFTKKGEAGVVSVVMAWGGAIYQPLFWPSSKEFLPPTQSPSLCRVSLGDEEYTLSGEKAAELFWLCRDAVHQASPGSFYTLGGERPIITLTFPLDDLSEWESFYSIDETDKCLSGFNLVSAQYAHQLPAGTYDKLLAALEEAGTSTDEAEAAPDSCTVEYGSGRRTVEGETAAELYRICADAQRRGMNIVPEEAKPETLSLSLNFMDERDPVSGPFCCVRADDSGWFADGLVYAPPCYAFPAGTFDALLAVLDRSGGLPGPAGERVASNEVYGLFEEDGVYALQLYNPEGDLVWAFGPGSHEPHVAEEEPGLWSVSLSAGPSPSLRWTVFYKPETGQLSDLIYGILARDGERVLCIAGKSLVLRGIFTGWDQVVLDEFSEPLAQTVEPFVTADFNEDGKAVVVTYLAREDYHEVTETILLPKEEGRP